MLLLDLPVIVVVVLIIVVAIVGLVAIVKNSVDIGDVCCCYCRYWHVCCYF